MTSCPKWEELARDESSSSSVVSAGYSLGKMFLYGCQRDSGRASVSKRFCLCYTGGTLDCDPSVKKKKRPRLSCTCSCDITVCILLSHTVEHKMLAVILI